MSKQAVVLVHRGALGDFLTAWPAVYGIYRFFQDHQLYWIGDPDRLTWLAPLGVRACPADLRQGFEALFSPRPGSSDLAGARLFWFGLAGMPPVQGYPGLVFLRGLDPERQVPVWREYAAQLESRGIPRQDRWLDAWQRLFPRVPLPGSPAVLLFPGAGHRAKMWPLVQFFDLARRIRESGLQPRFVFGPVETDQGLDTAGFAVERPRSLAELHQLVLGAQGVVGCDSGPMHLAGMSGVPGVVLFGPASVERWAPVGLSVVRAGIECSPCTMDGRIACKDPRCMALIHQHTVWRELSAAGIVR